MLGLGTRSARRRVRVGVFDDVPTARAAVEAARRRGYRRIEVVAREELRRRFGDLGVESPARLGWRGAALGASIGVIAASMLVQLWLMRSDPGNFVGAIILVAICAVFGAFVGVMASRGGTDEAQNFYDQELEPGQILVAIAVPEREPDARLDEVERILAENGAVTVVPLRDG